MNRVLLVCGSLQRASANRAALDVARAALAARGIEADLYDEIASIPPMNADHDGDPGAAVIGFRDRIGAADAVILAAPEYAGGLAGALKNALDWVVGGGQLYNKPIAILSAGTSGGVFARRDLVRTLSWQGAHVVESLGIAGPNARSTTDAGGARRFTDPATIGEIEAMVSSLIALAEGPPAARLPAITRLALDAGIDPAPLRDLILAQGG
ncbi:MAG: NAD(P)H-dependent oxidoreductase [Byssovorax sp.]